MSATDWLNYFGITPDKIFPTLLLGLLFMWFLWKYFLRDIKEEVTDLHNATKEVQKHLDDGKSFTPQHTLPQKPVFAYGKSNSPVIPNEKGVKLLTDAGFYKSVWPALENEIFTLLDSKNLRTLYDYEKGAKEVLEELKDNPSMDCLKEYAVNHPQEPLDMIFEVASWIIRDKYAEYKKSK